MTSDDVAASTQQLRGTVDAAKLLLQRGRSLTPRGGAHARHSGAADPVAAAHHLSKENSGHDEIAPRGGKVNSSVFERNAALDEASRLRRLLDNIGDVDQRVKDAVTQAVNKERHIHQEALERQRSHFEFQSKDLKEEFDKAQKTLQQRDKRIEALTLQLGLLTSAGASTNRLEKLEDQVTYLTAELLSRDGLVDAKNQIIKTLQERVDSLECSIGTSETTILSLRDREGSLQRDIVRVQNEFRGQIESLNDAVKHRDTSLAQAELLELGLHRELEDTQHQLRAALDLLQSTKESASHHIASLEDALHAHQLEATQTTQKTSERISNTRLCALEALSRCASTSTQTLLFKSWRWLVERKQQQRATKHAAFVSDAAMMGTQAELAKHQLFVESQRSLIDSFGIRTHSLLLILRHAEQQQSQLNHVVRHSESTATMQRQDLQAALNQARSDAIAHQQRSDALSVEIHEVRERLRVSEIDRERFRTEVDSEKKTLDAAKLAAQQRMREMESMYESRLADNSDSLRRERDVVERERASVARLISIQEASEKSMSELRLECARAQQTAAHLTSSLAHISNSKDHADGLFTRSEAGWKSERDQLLAALDAQRTATRDAMIQSVTRDTEERILRQRAEDAERALRESEYNFKKCQRDLADALERLEATQLALKQQLDTMTALRSASAQQRRRRGSAAISTSQTPALSRTPHVHLIEPSDEHDNNTTPERSTTTDPQPLLATPVHTTPPLVARQQPDESDVVNGAGAPAAAAVEQELQELTTSLAVAAAATTETRDLADNGGESGFAALGEEEDHPDLVILQASVDSLTSQLEFVQAECNKLREVTEERNLEVEALRTKVGSLDALQEAVTRLEDQTTHADAAHKELLEALQVSQERCSHLEKEHAGLLDKLAVANRLEDQLHEEQERVKLLEVELAHNESLEGEIRSLATTNALLQGERRLLEEQLTQSKTALAAAEREVHQIASTHSSSSDMSLVLGLQERLAAAQRDLLEEQASTARLQQELSVSTRRTTQLDEELHEITGMTGEMKSAYDALIASAPQPRSSRTTPPLPQPCSHCPMLEDQIASLHAEVEELSNELTSVKRNYRQPPPSATTTTEDKTATHDLRLALETAEVQLIKSHRALKRMEESKALQESRMKDLAQELSELHSDLTEERLLNETCTERHISLVRKLCQMLDLSFAELKDSADLDRIILVAVDGLQASQVLLGSKQETQQQYPSRSNSQSQLGATLGAMTAAEVEQALQKLVHTHKREIRKLSEANAQLWAICHSSVDKTMIGAALSLVANANTRRVVASAWHQWRIWREQKKRDQVVASAQRTISRLQEQHGRLKEIAATAMNQVKELEQRKR